VILSLFIFFLLVVEGLNKILTLGISKGYFESLGPILSHNQKIMHIQYVDDTLLFIRAQLDMVVKVKWALRVFEEISGLKINLNKSEMIPLNLDTSSCNFYANLLNCPVGKLSIKYLGVKLHWKKPSKQDWQLVIDKIHSKLPI
jgi:Reverse transcriptase (RNA-dependent DNA polymerase)